MRAGKRITSLLTTLLLASSASADYKDSYSRGLEAAKDGDWAELRARMQEAIADNPTPAPRVRLYGQRWEPYVPQYYLGLAAFKLGDCATALAQWRSASNQGVIGSVPSLKSDQDRNSASCDTRLAQQTPDKPGPATPPDKGVVTPDAGKSEPPKPEPPKPTPPKPVPPKPEVEPNKPEPPKPTPPKPTETPLAQRVPAALLEAVRAYLAGRYAEVARINPDTFGDARAKAQGYLIRAAARQIQAELEPAAGALDGAKADIRAARGLLPTLAPDAVLFSPRFRSLFTATR